ncbi:MAG: uncharacterized membrane protein (UPF0127 family) [Myxococcota bacterium]|jgi:uncharacterized membrane protein (UPF0127 family)
MRKLLFLICFFFSISANSNDFTQPLAIKSHKTGEIHQFLVKIAKNSQEKQKGLMFVKNLPDNYGMIFEFEKEQMINMWMKNTKIPLDMIFIDDEKKIIHIQHSTVPESLEIISSKFPALKILEINGGLAKKLSIKVSDEIVF